MVLSHPTDGSGKSKPALPYRMIFRRDKNSSPLFHFFR